MTKTLRLSLLLATLAAHPAVAGHFAMGVRAASNVRAGRVAVQLTLVNHGTEIMRHVRPAVWFQDAWHELPAYAELPPAAERLVQFDLGPTPALPGEFTAVVAVRYTDLNGHPFTTLKTMSIFTGEPLAAAPLHATLAPLTLQRRGALHLTVTSTADTPVTATVRLALPDELGGATLESTPLTLPPGGSVHRDYPVRNAWAIPGSQSRVFALIDYELAGRQVALVAPGLITVRQHRELPARVAHALWAIPAILALGYLALLFRARCAARAAPPAPGGG